MFGQDYIDSLMQRFGMSEDELADYILHSGAKSDDEVLSGLIRNQGADNAFIQGNFGKDAAARAAFNAKVIADRKDRLSRQNKGAVPSYKAEESRYPRQAREALVKGATDIDPLLQLGLLNSVYGDNDILQMYNTNKQNEQQRRADAEREEYVKAVEQAEDAKTKSFEEAKERKEALKTAQNEADKAFSLIYDNSSKGTRFADVSDIDWTNLKIARNAVEDAGGDTKRYDEMIAQQPVKKNSTEKTISDLKAKKERILENEKPKASDKAAVKAYDDEIDAFNAELSSQESDIQTAVGLISQDKKIKYVAPKSFDPSDYKKNTKANRQKLKDNGYKVVSEGNKYAVKNKSGVTIFYMEN